MNKKKAVKEEKDEEKKKPPMEPKGQMLATAGGVYIPPFKMRQQLE